MRPTIALLAAVAAVLVAGTTGLALEEPRRGEVLITVECYSAPELVRVQVTDELQEQEVSIVGFASLVDPGEEEPFLVRDEFTPGTGAPYYFGPGAPENKVVLTDRLIFDDDDPGEGVAVIVRRFGSELPESELPALKVLCEERSKYFQVGEAEPPTMPDTGAGATAGVIAPMSPIAAALPALAAGLCVLRQRR